MYLAVLVLVQSLWMYLFVQYFWPLRGDTFNHLGFLLLANAAMTTVCLGISANCKNPDQASLLSIYLVGFQLPLSGAVLALPTMIESITQPFISAYWAWSGSVMGLDNDVLKAVNGIVQTSFSPPSPCATGCSSRISSWASPWRTSAPSVNAGSDNDNLGNTLPHFNIWQDAKAKETRKA